MLAAICRALGISLADLLGEARDDMRRVEPRLPATPRAALTHLERVDATRREIGNATLLAGPRTSGFVLHQGAGFSEPTLDVDALASDRDRVALLDRVVDRHRQLGRVEGVRDLPGAELVRHGAEGLPVVVVAVRGDRGAQLRTVRRADHLREAVRLVRRVDQQRLAGRGAHEQVGVVVHRSDRDLGDRQCAEVAAGSGPARIGMSAVVVEDVHDRGAYGPRHVVASRRHRSARGEGASSGCVVGTSGGRERGVRTCVRS